MYEDLSNWRNNTSIRIEITWFHFRAYFVDYLVAQNRNRMRQQLRRMILPVHQLVELEIVLGLQQLQNAKSRRKRKWKKKQKNTL